MFKFGFATMAATGIAAALVGLAAPAVATTISAAPAGLNSVEIPADLGHQLWVIDTQQQQTTTPPPSHVGNSR